MTFNFSEQPVTYVVTAEIKSGTLTEVYRGSNRVRAEDTCNFWDERVNSYFEVIRLPMDALSVANRKFDALMEYIKER